MATQQRHPASRLSGGNILSRMLQLEKQSKVRLTSARSIQSHHRSSSAAPTQTTSHNVYPSISPVAAAAALLPAARPLPQKSHTVASPAAIRQSQSVPPAPSSSPNLRSQSPAKPASNDILEKSHQRPSTLPRSQTLPALSIDVLASDSARARKDSKTEMADDEDSASSEICQSPSWSDFGGTKRKKEKKRQEKDRKEEEKRLKKEEARQKAADLKAGKRLSKRPPPAAMETQKMPSALRRNSIISYISSHSSSGENSRRNSRDEKRLSVSSVDSAKGAPRTQSTPGTSTEIRPGSSEGWKAVVSPVAPQLPRLPRLGWHSRSGSSGTDKSRSWGSDDAYEKELVNFAYQFQAAANPSAPKDIILGNVKVNQVSVQHGPKRQSGTWPMARSQTDSDLARLNGAIKAKEIRHQPPDTTRRGSEDRGVVNSQSHHNEHRDTVALRPTSRESTADKKANERQYKESKMGNAHSSKTADTSKALPTPAAQRRPSFDGSSYVHKQRMHQQQLSIAGFEDEQAIRIANERLAEDEERNSVQENQKRYVDADEAVAPPPQNVDPPKPQPQKPPPSLEIRNKSQESPSTQSAGQGSHTTKDIQKAAANDSSPTSRTSKVDKLLGIRRRQKPDHDRLSTSGHTSVAAQKASKLSPPPLKDTSPPPIPSPQGKIDALKSQNAVEATSKAHQHKKPYSGDVTKPEARKEDPKPAPVQSHSRTRTSSSQLLNEDLLMSRPMPRTSTTAPVLSPEMKLSSALAVKSQNEPPASRLDRKSVTFDGATAEAPGTEQQPKPTQSKAPEIVIESVSPEGVVRKTSIKRPRSNPNLQLASTNAQLPSLDFLPQLKHQPLPKRSPNRGSFLPSPERPMSSQFPAPISLASKPTPDASTTLPQSASSPSLSNSQQHSPRRPDSYAGPSSSSAGDMSLRTMPNHIRRRNMSPSASSLTRTAAMGPPNVFGRTPTPSESVNAKPMAKLFVICCKCNYWHDLPSHLYEAMCVPKNLTRDPEGQEAEGKEGKKKVAEATLETMVKCPWCEHFMTTWCCAGWTAILYLQERHH
ncbi:MAG: hypothetical protein Q9220_005627 [cf. Caloplaca sp. 1 TL-2023]